MALAVAVPVRARLDAVAQGIGRPLATLLIGVALLAAVSNSCRGPWPPPRCAQATPTAGPSPSTWSGAADATITVNNLLNTQQPTPVSLAKLATLTHDRSPMFWITVRRDQVLKIGEQWMP